MLLKQRLCWTSEGATILHKVQFTLDELYSACGNYPLDSSVQSYKVLR